MQKHCGLRLAAIATMALAGSFHLNALAQTAEPPLRSAARWELSFSPYTHHWHHDDAHKNVALIAIERFQPDNALWGAALFNNSFGQTSGYVYYGHQWDGVFGQPGLYTKLSAGVIYGYRGKYKDKVPYNHDGFSPAIIPAIGYRLTPVDAVQVAILGTAGVMFSYSRRF